MSIVRLAASVGVMSAAFHRILKGRRNAASPCTLFADALLPALCVHCERRLLMVDEVVCGRCRARLASCRRDRIHVLRAPDDDAVPIRVLSRWIYASGSPVRTLHRALKYGGRPDIGRLAGLEMGRVVRRRSLIANEKTLVVPVPSHPVRIAERGYNHAEELARGVSGELMLACAPAVVRRRRLALSQSGILRGEREGNVQDAFAVSDRSAISDRPILVVDDVFTTGATLRELTSVLRRAGAADIAALTMAIRIVR